MTTRIGRVAASVLLPARCYLIRRGGVSQSAMARLPAPARMVVGNYYRSVIVEASGAGEVKEGRFTVNHEKWVLMLGQPFEAHQRPGAISSSVFPNGSRTAVVDGANLRFLDEAGSRHSDSRIGGAARDT